MVHFGTSEKGKMAGLSKWVVAWLIITSLVALWDTAFVLLRPESMTGGKYHALFSPYDLYTSVDKAYGDLHNPWIKTQSVANVAEIFLNFVVLVLHFSGSPKAIPLCTVVLSFTFWKTLLYFGMEACEEFSNIKHNPIETLILLYIIPNGIWIIAPFFSLIWCFNRSSEALTTKQTNVIKNTNATKKTK